MKNWSGFGPVLFALLATASAAFASQQTNTLAQATLTAQHMKTDPAFGSARNMLSQARGVLIIPRLVKAGFIFGAESGDGVLVGKTPTGWSDPAFFSMSSASFGLQLGLEKAEIVMLIMNDKALNAVQNGDFKFGAGAGLTVATLSGGAAAGNLAGDILVWTSGTGAYGGLTLNGSSIRPRYDWNTEFYGRPVGIPDILVGNVQNPNSNQLQAALNTLGRG